MYKYYLSLYCATGFIIDFIQSQNVAYASMRSRLSSLAFTFFIVLLPSISAAQNCGPNTPVIPVDLTGNPDSVWISPDITRNDLCCNADASETCVEFVLTLDPSSQGIIFNIHSGAIPPGALYYQVNCGMITTVGQLLCLTGPGPHRITFCKPGNNSNEYSITAIPQTSASPAITLNDGCTGSMMAYGYDPASVTWTSVYPGAAGAYNSYLDCAAGCDSVNVTPQPGFPSYVDYRVCGLPAGGCTSTMTCSIIRVNYNPTLANTFDPPQPTVCYGSAGITVTAIPSGGTPPYTYAWNTGATSASAFLQPGTYTVTIGDASSCPPIIETIVVRGFNSAITANAGADQSVCIDQQALTLQGVVTGVTTGVWTGGNGIFSGGNTALTTNYTPTASEIAAGFVNLTLTTTNNGTCPAASDNITIRLSSFDATLSASVTNVSCFNGNDGSVALNVNGANGPYSFAWNTAPAQSSQSIYLLAAGSYTSVVTDGSGCRDTITATVMQPAALYAGISSTSNVTCHGAANGTISTQTAGGTGAYHYTWSTAPVQHSPTATGLTAGSYTVTVTDDKGCSAAASATITQPSPVITNAYGSASICPGQQTVIGSSATGGAGSYSYSWHPALGNSASHAVSPESTATYTVTAIDNFGCAGTAETITVTVIRLVQSDLQVSPATNMCEGGSAIIQATVANPSSPVTFAWTPMVGTSGGPYSVNPAETTTYTVTVTDQCGTRVSSSIQVIVNPLPRAYVAPHYVSGCDKVELSFRDSSKGQGATYLWNFGDGSSSFLADPAHAYTESGTYVVSLMVTSAHGCTSYASAMQVVNVFASPVAEFSASASEVSLTDPTVHFSDRSSNSISWDWSFGDGAVSVQPSPSHTYPAKGVYKVTLVAYSDGGCVDTTSEVIEVDPVTTLFVPTAFTPNGDGKNDVFMAQGLEIYEFVMSVFDRWGNMIFSSESIEDGWDGRANGGTRVAQSDVYVYKILYKDFDGNRKQELGHVALVR